MNTAEWVKTRLTALDNHEEICIRLADVMAATCCGRYTRLTMRGGTIIEVVDPLEKFLD